MWLRKWKLIHTAEPVHHTFFIRSMTYKKHQRRILGLKCQFTIPSMPCAKLQTISQTQKFMSKKSNNHRNKKFQEGKKWFVHCLMTRIHAESHSQGCVNFDRIRDIIGQELHNGVFAPGFFDYLRLAAYCAIIAFRPGRWHRSVIFGPPVTPVKE